MLAVSTELMLVRFRPFAERHTLIVRVAGVPAYYMYRFSEGGGYCGAGTNQRYVLVQLALAHLSNSRFCQFANQHPERCL